MKKGRKERGNYEMLSIVSPYKPVIVTSCRTLVLECSYVKEIKRAFGPEVGIHEAWRMGVLKNQAETLPKAIELVQGKLPQEDVSETDEHFKINDLFLCLKLRQEMILDQEWRDEARLTLVSDLTNLGFRVAALIPDPKVYQYADPTQIEKMRTAGVAEEDMIFISHTDQENPVGSFDFPRDLFVQIDNTVYLSPDKENSYNWDNFFKWAKGLKRNYSRIAVGGEVIMGNDFALVSDPAKQNLEFLGEEATEFMEFAEMMTLGEAEETLRAMGKQVFRIPTGWTELYPPHIIEEIGGSKPILMPADHADLQVLHLPEENGLFFSERYYRDNRDLLDSIVEQIRPNLSGTLPDEDGLPINSLPLPGGGVYMDAAATESARILRDAGIRVETTSVPYGSWAWGTNAGIHCSTNLINLPDPDLPADLFGF